MAADLSAIAHDIHQRHAAVILRETHTGDRELLAQLRSQVDVVVIDNHPAMLQETASLRPPLRADQLSDGRHWAWYPWRRTLVSVLGASAFRRLRLDRNRNKITAAEQDGFSRLTIGVIGLSVGHAIAHTLALEGLCGELRLADNDTIELSNLNRIPATVLDMGVNKSVVVARRIAELDPHLPVKVFTSGINEECMSEFFDGLDLVIEECDSLDMKLRVREAAKVRGIPVLMETSDRGLFDVERFDLEPDRELFHGLLGDIDPDALRGLSTHDKAPHVMRILQTQDLSAKMAASMVEIDRTLATWPQLGGDVQLGGATVAAAVRRFGRGESLRSGRIRIDLDESLHQLRDPIADAAAAPPPAAEIDLTQDIPTEPLDAVIHAIQLAPSGGNIQPWSVELTPAGVDIHLERQRTSAMDIAYRGSYVSIGAAAMNATVAAARHSLTASITEFPRGTGSDLTVSVALAPGANPDLSAMYPGMVRRISNRNFGRRRPLAPTVLTDLHRGVDQFGGRLHLVTETTELAALADVLAASDRIRFLTPLLHEQMMDEMVWPSVERAALGIDVNTLGLDDSDLAKLEVAKRADVMRQLASWDAGEALGDTTRDRLNASSAVAVLTVSGDGPADYLRGGMAVEQFWVQAEAHHLAVQPVSPVFIYARKPAELEDLSPRFSTELGALQRRFDRIVGLTESEVVVLVLRLSHDAPPPVVRSQRLDRAQILKNSSHQSEGSRRWT